MLTTRKLFILNNTINLDNTNFMNNGKKEIEKEKKMYLQKTKLDINLLA